MVAIAMTREMGTLGKDVAQGIADSLDLNVVHSELVEHDLALAWRTSIGNGGHLPEGDRQFCVSCGAAPLRDAAWPPWHGDGFCRVPIFS